MQSLKRINPKLGLELKGTGPEKISLAKNATTKYDQGKK